MESRFSNVFFCMLRFLIFKKIFECREIANFGPKHRGADLLCQRIFQESVTYHTRKGDREPNA